MITKEKVLEILEENSILSRAAGRVVIYENDWENIGEEVVKNCSKDDTAEQHKQLFSFFMWFRKNGEQHMGKSIESMLDIYLKSIDGAAHR